MRILHLLNEFREIGNGIVNVAVDLACIQARLGHVVAVASGGGEYEGLVTRFGVSHYRLDQTRTPGNLVRALAAFRAIVRKFEPDVVHAHMMTGAVLAWVARRAHPYALVTTVHNEYQRSAILMSLGDRVVAVSEAVRQAMARRGCPPVKLRVVRNGTVGSPRREFSLDAGHGESADLPIVTVGAVSYRKGSDVLVRAFARIGAEFPNTHLFFVGNRDWPDVERLAAATGYGHRIHFVGFRRDPRPYLAGAVLFVLASRREPFGLVLTEAREMGLPIVASNVDGIPEALDGGRAGLLVPPGNDVALAEAMARLLRNEDERRALASRALEGLERFTVERMAREYLEVYAEAMGQARSRARVKQAHSD